MVPRSAIAEDGGEPLFKYRRLWYYSAFLVSAVAVAPLIIMTLINFQQYHRVFQTEMLQPVFQLTSSAKGSLEHFIADRESALTLVVNERSFEELADQETLDTTFSNLKKSYGGFVDLGLIDSAGCQQSYVGPYDLKGKQYDDQDWFHEVRLRGAYVSDVFLGYRKFPHFIIAVMRENQHGDFHVLRATVDTEVLDRHIRSLDLRPSSDAFIINRSGVLQTSSRLYGDALTGFPLKVPPYSKQVEVVEERYDGHSLVVGHAFIEDSPFVFMVVKEPKDLMRNWFALRKELIWILIISVGLILIVILLGVTYMVNRIRESDLRRGQALHSAQYASKMATIGRLAAGVAHEINNPLAIVNEKAGLLQDLLSFEEDFPQRERFLANIASILKSVDRCSAVTHRLLGFAKHMDVSEEVIDLVLLIREVLTFLEKEAIYRNVSINVDAGDDVPAIESDRGQLQQVFLNIINNAVDAVDDGGQIDISVFREAENTVQIVINDNGQGISEEDLKHIFDPFFTTKKGYGTGLGLSITYGIIERLGGTIGVRNNVDRGASFTVRLPVTRGN